MSWQIDYVNSEIRLKIRRMMISWAHGIFEKFEGMIALDEQNPELTTVSIKIDAASLNTRQPDRDASMLGDHFLDASNYPYVTFTSTSVEQVGLNAAKMTGDLTIRDITKEAVLDVTYSGQQKSLFGPFLMAGFSAETVISRKEWGIDYNMVMDSGGLALGDEIYVTVDLELTKPVMADQLSIAAG